MIQTSLVITKEGLNDKVERTGIIFVGMYDMELFEEIACTRRWFKGWLNFLRFSWFNLYSKRLRRRLFFKFRRRESGGLFRYCTATICKRFQERFLFQVWFKSYSSPSAQWCHQGRQDQSPVQISFFVLVGAIIAVLAQTQEQARG